MSHDEPGREYDSIADLPKEKLLELVANYSKNWIAHDGLWFQSVESEHGMEEANRHNINAWRRFTVIEAKRIKQFLDLPERAGLDGLRRALAFRMYAPLNKTVTTIEGNVLTYDVTTCRVQAARERKGMPFHPCKPVGLVEYGLFASTIDDRFTTECVSCFPDITCPTSNCVWRFTLNE
ncbi:MAG: DUF6125 family protein [Planctomycetaceae bacterium]|nr:DUF6125 family protein [Planctomycetaceae bacterium]